MELLVRLEDRGDPTDPTTAKRGDVIDIRPDGWPWSERERNHPARRLIRVPDLTPADAQALLASEQIPVPLEPFLTPDLTAKRHRRTAFIDLDALDATPEMTSALAVTMGRATADGDPGDTVVPEVQRDVLISVKATRI